MSTTLSAKSSFPLAIAPTNTAIECVSGSVGRNFDNRTVGASPESAVVQSQCIAQNYNGGKLTEFNRIDREVIRNGILYIGSQAGINVLSDRVTLMTLSSFSGPF